MAEVYIKVSVDEMLDIIERAYEAAADRILQGNRVEIMTLSEASALATFEETLKSLLKLPVEKE